MSLQRAGAGKLTLCQSDVAQGEIHRCVCIPWIVLDSNRFYFLVKKYFLTLESLKKKPLFVQISKYFYSVQLLVHILKHRWIHSLTLVPHRASAGRDTLPPWAAASHLLEDSAMCVPFANGTYFQWSDLKILFVFSRLEIQWMNFRLTFKC